MSLFIGHESTNHHGYEAVYKAKVEDVEPYKCDERHSYRGETNRTRVMFGEPGHLYVYFTYGMHYCCNVVTGQRGVGAAVLIRAVEPLEGEEIIVNRRGRHGVEATNGPAKLCQALDIDMALSGHDLHHEPLRLIPMEPLEKHHIVHTNRIGISKAIDMPWRFYIKHNPYVSRP